MAIFTIRAHKRFAVCRKVRLRQQGRRGIHGLLIELSLDGCRISHDGGADSLAMEDTLILTIAGTAPIAARVRWLGDGTTGLRFVQPLHVGELENLIRLCRGTVEASAPRGRDSAPRAA